MVLQRFCEMTIKCDYPGCIATITERGVTQAEIEQKVRKLGWKFALYKDREPARCPLHRWHREAEADILERNRQICEDRLRNRTSYKKLALKYHLSIGSIGAILADGGVTR
jgi:hypothetical protein